jgi:hypothetical protein
MLEMTLWNASSLPSIKHACKNPIKQFDSMNAFSFVAPESQMTLILIYFIKCIGKFVIKIYELFIAQ